MPDVVVFFRGYYPDTQPLFDWCKRHGIRIVFDTDDALDMVPRENVNYGMVQRTASSYTFLLEHADLVTTTTPELAAHLRQWNPNVSVLPNSVDPEEWSVRRRHGTPRIGWTGSSTHFMDLAILLEGVRQLQRRHDFHFILQGISSCPTIRELYELQLAEGGERFLQSAYGKSFKRFLDMLKGLRYEFRPSVPVVHHAAAVCDLGLDIGLAPLLEDAFNRHKSCIKFYEYAMSGAVALASSVLPYRREVPLLTKNNTQSWMNKLEWLLAADKEALWRDQREWVLANRNAQTNVALWEAAYAGAETETPVAHQADPVFSL
jgi:hypothetical protein